MADSFNDYANKRFYGTADVMDGPITVTVKSFAKEIVDGDDGKEKLSTMTVEESDQKVVLKPTQLAVLTDLFGKPSNAIGKPVELFLDKSVTFGGKKVGGLRIRAAAGQATSSPAPF